MIDRKQIYILGLGLSGMSLASFLKKRNILFKCWDDDLEKRKRAQKYKFQVQIITFNELRNASYLVVTPGINHQSKSPHQVIKIAQELGVKIVTDIEFIKIFDLNNNCLYTHLTLPTIYSV